MSSTKALALSKRRLRSPRLWRLTLSSRARFRIREACASTVTREGVGGNARTLQCGADVRQRAVRRAVFRIDASLCCGHGSESAPRLIDSRSFRNELLCCREVEFCRTCGSVRAILQYPKTPPRQVGSTVRWLRARATSVASSSGSAQCRRARRQHRRGAVPTLARARVWLRGCRCVRAPLILQ